MAAKLTDSPPDCPPAIFDQDRNKPPTWTGEAFTFGLDLRGCAFVTVASTG